MKQLEVGHVTQARCRDLAFQQVDLKDPMTPFTRMLALNIIYIMIFCLPKRPPLLRPA